MSTNRKERGCWLRSRCYACGHTLRFQSTGCPQCGENFDGRKNPKRWPRVCDCARCRPAAAEAQLIACHECGGQEFCEDCWPKHEKDHDEGRA